MADNLEKINNYILKNEKKILLIILLISSIGIFILASNIDNQWCQDSHWHMSLIKNLGEGKGYSLDGSNPHGQYPPGFAILILPFYLILKNVHLAGLILIGILSLGTLFITYKTGKLFSPFIALISTIFLMFHNLFIFYSVSIMTEIPFMFFSMLGLYLFLRGFEKPKYFLFTFPILAFTVLIRYSGAFMIFPILYYTYLKKEKSKKLIFSDKVLLGIAIGIFIFLFWFIRNFIAFGDPFYTAYTSVAHEINFEGFIKFAKLFFHLGFIFPFLSLPGFIFSLKSKNSKLKFYLIWFLSYFILHAAWWGGGVFRFYAGILPVLCLFASYGVIISLKKLKINSKKFIFLILLILLLFSSLQSYIFFSGFINHETTLQTLNRYAPIKQISEWTNKNFSPGYYYLVPDTAVYSLYTDKNLIHYNIGINQLLQNNLKKEEVLLISDNLHTWMTKPYLEGENGTIQLPMQNGNVLLLETALIKRIDYKNRYAILLNITDIKIGTYP